MKHLIVLFFALLLNVTAAFAQVPQRDVVYLKNGSIIRGLVVELVPDHQVKIATADGSIFVYPVSDVLRMEKEDDYDFGPFRRRYYRYDNHNPLQRRHGYVGMVEGGLNLSLNDGYMGGALYTTHGAQITDKWFVGVGWGCDGSDEHTYSSFYADARYFFNKNKSKVDPYLEFKLGYVEDLDDGLDYYDANNSVYYYTEGDFSGCYFSPSFGLSFPFGRRKASFLMNLSYVAMFNADRFNNHVAFRVGFAF